MARERRDIKFQLVISPTEARMLQDLSDEVSLNRSICVRQAILNYYTMLLLNKPTCADGRACSCPQYVARQAPLPPQTLLEADARQAADA